MSTEPNARCTRVHLLRWPNIGFYFITTWCDFVHKLKSFSHFIYSWWTFNMLIAWLLAEAHNLWYTHTDNPPQAAAGVFVQLQNRTLLHTWWSRTFFSFIEHANWASNRASVSCLSLYLYLYLYLITGIILLGKLMKIVHLKLRVSNEIKCEYNDGAWWHHTCSLQCT